MGLKKILQDRLDNYTKAFSDVNEVCAIYVVDINNSKYIQKIYKYEEKRHQYTKLLQKGFVLFTDSTIKQAVLETTEYNMALRKVDDAICFVLISEKSLTFGKIIALMKQRLLYKRK